MPSTLRSRSKTPSRGGASPSSSPSKKASSGSGCDFLCGWCPVKCSPKNQAKCRVLCTALFSLLCVVGAVAATHHRCNWKPSVSNIGEKIGMGIRCCLLPTVAYVMSIKYVMFKRVQGGYLGANPNVGTHCTEQANCILRNTLEQYVYHVMAVMGACTFATADCFKFLALASVLWTLGRVCFFFGYPNRREFGFMLGWLANGLMMLFVFYSVWTKGWATL